MSPSAPIPVDAFLRDAPARRQERGARSSSPRGDEAMARYAEGDDGAFAPLYDEVAPRLRAFLLRQTREQARADDLLQQTMLQMHRARGTFVRGAPVMPWAFAIARRLLIDEERRSQRRNRVFDGCEAPEVSDPCAVSAFQHLHNRQLSEHLERELLLLPGVQREAFELLRMEGLTLFEAAQATGSTVSALKSRSHRAYEALREALVHLFGE